MEYRTDSLSLNFSVGVSLTRFVSCQFFFFFRAAEEEMNEPRYRLVHEWVVGGWLSDWTLLARAGAGEGQNASSIDDRVSSA